MKRSNSWKTLACVCVFFLAIQKCEHSFFFQLLTWGIKLDGNERGQDNTQAFSFTQKLTFPAPGARYAHRCLARATLVESVGAGEERSIAPIASDEHLHGAVAVDAVQGRHEAHVVALVILQGMAMWASFG